jgi:Uma2 family endonuclease
MSAATEFAPHYTIDDYQLWKGDWELWDGIAIAMTPSPFGPHQAVMFSLVAELRAGIRSQGCEATALGELDWIVSNDTVVRPDVIVVCGDAPEKHLQQPPALVAEILSRSTRQNDLTYKRELYAKQGVGTYLIVDPETKTIEQLTLTPSGKYRSTDASTRLEVTVCGDCVIAVESTSIFTG